jgi:GNAT superfamily N-acetyltransferase
VGARVRPGSLEDAEQLVAFNAAMALETEGKALDPEALARGVRRVLSEPDRGLYFVAERDVEAGPEVVGALFITREWSDWRDAWFWWIQSVYVRPESRRQGVYRDLYRAVQDRAQAAGDVCGLRLYVEGSNHVARRCYEQLGMEHASYEMYEVDWS